MPTGPRPLRATVADSLGAEATAWDALVAASPLPSPFLRSWWVDAAAGRERCIVLVHDGDRLVGGMALEVDRRLRVPRYLAAGAALAPDHVDVVAERGREAEIAAAVVECLREQGSWFLDLSCAPESPVVATAFGEWAETTPVEVAPWTPLPSSFEAYLRERPDGLPKRVARARKRFAAAGIRYEHAGPDAVDRNLADLRRLHAEVFGGGSLFLPHFDRFTAVAHRAVGTGELAFHELRVDDETIAIDAVLEVAGRVSTYQGGRSTDPRWRGAGLVLQSHLIEGACERGATEFDHLRGRTDYKLSWAPELRLLTRVLAAHGLAGRAARTALTLRERPGLAGMVSRVRSRRNARPA